MMLKIQRVVKTGISYSYKWRNNLVEKALCELGTDQHNEILL